MRTALPLSFAALAAASCGRVPVVVTVEIDVDDPAGAGTVARALSDLEVRVLPYDQDAVFDSMTAAHATPEPEVSAELIASRERARAAQSELEQAQLHSNLLRDSLARLNAVMQPLDRGGAQYAQLLREVTDLEGRLPAVEAHADTAFVRFDSLQRRAMHAGDSVRMRWETWSDSAFAGATTVIDAKIEASGRRVAVDTTDASGATNIRVRPGRYWVRARYPLPNVELIWNMPITVARGEPVRVRLSRENAEERIGP